METTETKTEFHVTDETSANWLLRKLANIEAEKQRVKQQATQIIASLDADASRLRYLYGGELETFACARLSAAGNRTKTLRLLQGTLAFRTVPAHLEITDADAALDYAELRAAMKGNPDGAGPESFPNCARLEPVFDAAAYRDAAEAWFRETGEPLPGITAVPEHEAFSIRFGKAKGGEE